MIQLQQVAANSVLHVTLNL